MSTVTVNISFQDRFLSNIDRIARRESRSRSELLREAARIYIERKQRWDKIFAKTSIQSGKQAITEKDVLDEISYYRSEKRKQKCQ
ncbi:MAG: ribbon-helix-helix domain-containing protein [Thermodesulfobacteriota bacterium]|nr:ribbon-helix-helix domain-containing protein [Thermodesulfobacteriota bacterium]